jgi:hypothetical protein
LLAAPKFALYRTPVQLIGLEWLQRLWPLNIWMNYLEKCVLICIILLYFQVLLELWNVPQCIRMEPAQVLGEKSWASKRHLEIQCIDRM